MASYQKYQDTLLLLLLLLLLIILLAMPQVSSQHSHTPGGECPHDHEEDEDHHDTSAARRLQIIGIVSILVGSALGVLIPILARRFHAIQPDSSIFFPIKAFAAGVILATAMIHMLPGGIAKLSSPCLKENPWHKFPFGGFIAMLAAVGTLIIENLAANYYERVNLNKARSVKHAGDEEKANYGNSIIPAQPDATSHGHAHGMVMPLDEETLRHRIVSQVLELGIVTHSVIIGMAIGTSRSTSTIKPLVAALTFHQFFEGMGLGGCLVQAKFKLITVTIMAILFSLTTPLGVAIGIGIASSYDENSRKALIVEGVLDSTSAGILIYAALVDLLATDFSNPKLRTSGKLQIFSYVALLIGLGVMSVIGKWA